MNEIQNEDKNAVTFDFFAYHPGQWKPVFILFVSELSIIIIIDSVSSLYSHGAKEMQNVLIKIWNLPEMIK